MAQSIHAAVTVSGVAIDGKMQRSYSGGRRVLCQTEMLAQEDVKIRTAFLFHSAKFSLALMSIRSPACILQEGCAVVFVGFDIQEGTARLPYLATLHSGNATSSVAVPLGGARLQRMPMQSA